MNDNELLDLYTDYLISSFGQTSGTGLSTLLDGALSHDRVQRFLASPRKGGADFWKVVKPFIRQIQRDDGVLIVDDSIAEKPYTDENDIICWHYDHSRDRLVKGINFITALYHVQNLSLPVGYELIEKTEHFVDKKTGKDKRRSTVSKNEVYQDLIRQAVRNQIPFSYVLNDVWYASADNMKFVKHELKRDFVMPLKTNRKVAVSGEDKQHGRFVRVDTLELEPGKIMTIYLESVDFPLSLVKQVFTNEDGSIGTLHLVTSGPDLTYDDITTRYGKRWHVEPYHKSLKQNASLEKSPTRTETTQSNHFFAAVCAYLKLEMLKSTTQTNHFALKSKLYVRALRTAFDTLQELQPIRLAA